MPKNDHDRRDDEGDPEAAANDLGSALEQLDRAAARVRQLIYRARALLRERNDGKEEEESRDERKPTRGQFRQRRG